MVIIQSNEATSAGGAAMNQQARVNDDRVWSPILSLCVPTYKRRKELEECIESISFSASRGAHKIELLISDNASPDDTWDYLLALQTRQPAISIFRQTENVGAERNIYGLVERACGEWLWVIGDDDLLEPEAIGEVLSALKLAPPAVVLNYSVWSSDFSRLVKRMKFSACLPKRCETSDDLMRQFGIEIGYCSALVFRKDHFSSVDRARYERFSPYGFAFLYAFYSGARFATDFQYIGIPIVRNRAANSTGFDWYKYFVGGTTMVLDQLGVEGYSKAAITSAKESVVMRFVLHDILVRKRDGADTSKVFGITRKAYGSFAIFWLGIVPALAIPARLVRWAHHLLEVWRKTGRLSTTRE